MTRRKETDRGVDAFFEAALRDVPEPRAAFLEQLATEARIAVAQPPTPVRVGLVAMFGNALGGWRGMGSLVAASGVGFWIGLAPPSLLPDPALMWTAFDVAPVTLEGTFDLTGDDLIQLEDS